MALVETLWQMLSHGRTTNKNDYRFTGNLTKLVQRLLCVPHSVFHHHTPAAMGSNPKLRACSASRRPSGLASIAALGTEKESH